MSIVGTAGLMHQDGVISGQIINSEGDDKRLIISACNLNIAESVHDTTDVFKAMVDLGANVNIGPLSLGRALGLQIMPHTSGRKIGTADTEGEMEIVGWIFPRGYTGPIAMVTKAAYTLLSVIQLQRNGMGVYCPPDRPVCVLTIFDNMTEIIFIELTQSAPTNLFFVDIRKLISGYFPEYIQPLERINQGEGSTLTRSSAGITEMKCLLSEQLELAPEAGRYKEKRIHDVHKKRSTRLTLDIIFRVWNLHNNMNHVALSTIAYMLKMGTLKNATCTQEEVILVRDHQHCLACMLAKAKAIDKTPSSGIRPNIIGRSWSMDYQGPYRTLAIGGYSGRYLFVERSRGYQISFLVREKTEAYACVDKVDKHCKRYGHVFRELQVDSGSVETSAEFQRRCHMINLSLGQQGIEVNTVNINMQQQNVIERHVQTHDNMFAALMADNDLLPASFWGLGMLAVTDTMNNVTNTLCEDGHTPAFYFEGRSTNLNLQFRVGFGKPVVCTRVCKSKGPKIPGISRNEFGVCVGPGNLNNGAVWVYLPSRGAHSLSLRYHVRPIRLGVTKQMSLEDGKQYIPTLGSDGVWNLMSRGESSNLSRKFAMAYDADLSSPHDHDKDEISTSSLVSSIASDRALKQFELITEEESVQDHQIEPNLHMETRQKNEVSESLVARPRRASAGQRPRRFIDACVADKYTAYATISQEEFARRNPKWNKAKNGPECDDWLIADNLERNQQCKQQPGKLGPHMVELLGGKSDVPRGTPIFPIKRVCKIKSNNVYKVRWAVLGNLEDVNDDCYAPTAAKKIVWLIFALSILLGLHRRFYDITGAFMAEKCNRDIYVTIDSKVYKLMYSLYGLKDAAKLFNEGLVAHLKRGGYIQSEWDQCLFYKWESCSSFIYLIFHVDDFMGCGTTTRILDEFYVHMENKYVVTSNVDGVFLGIHIEQHDEVNDGNFGCAYIFRKPHQLQTIFDKYLPNGPNISLPRDPMQESYSKSFNVNDSAVYDIKEFRSCLGAVMQLTDCRPDIAFTISKISQRQCSPRAKDMQALTFLIHYLWATKDKGVILRGFKSSANMSVRLRGFTDCSFACHGNGKSHYCICFDLVNNTSQDDAHPFNQFVNTGMFYLKSFMATTVDLSSCQGETSATVESVKDAIFFRGILQELHHTQVKPTPIYGDNDSTRNLATHYDGSHKRVRYMLPKINWLMEQTTNNVIKMIRLGTQELPPDVGTKNGRGVEFSRKRDRVMGY